MLVDLLNIPTQDEIIILNKPEEFSKQFSTINFSASLVHTSCVEFVIIFVRSKHDFINQMMTLFPRLVETSVIWIIFPVATTKKDLANLSLAFDWDFLGDYRLQPMRQVNINEEWKAIRLKKAKFD